ncbi:MAG TPA: hypothetical protein VGH80_08755 [Xanthomonadaceae bacterium]|jgi:tetratricopeptide (TPR) repeat protein
MSYQRDLPPRRETVRRETNWPRIIAGSVIALVAMGVRLGLAGGFPHLHFWGLSAPFTPSEAAAFLDRAEKAEAIADPLQRCLAFPDPPGSHWSRRTVDAYCRYSTQPVITTAEIVRLVDGNQAAELDRRMADALHAQRTNPAALGRLDQTFFVDFKDSTAALRPTLDAWKQQSPNSAFAWAASGVAYVAQARAARGTGLIRNTPASAIEAMQGMIALARPDLEKAERLDPQITPVYAAMIETGILDGDGRYARAAIARGLRIDPANYWIHSRAIWLSRPVWGGSRREVREAVAKAQVHARSNPLLELFLPEDDAVEYRIDCACTSKSEIGAFRKVFDRIGAAKLFGNAGRTAESDDQSSTAVVYLSEAIRFDPTLVDEHMSLVDTLTDLHRNGLAKAEADRFVALEPDNKFSYEARSYYERSTGHLVDAENDVLAALKLAPDDAWALDELGDDYVHRSRQFDKGWDVADRLIKAHPDDPNGWLLRASIQKDQPRPGLHDTLVYFLAHFGDDPAVQELVPRMRAELAKEERQAKARG